MRLRVSYKSPAALLGEFTRSVGKGTVALESAHRLPVGTRFVFELRAQGVEVPVEVLGEVVEVAAPSPGKYLLGVRYDPGGGRDGVDTVLRKIFEAQANEKARRFPRVPIRLQATEDAPRSASYLIRDLSRGGVGIEVEAPRLPEAVRVGTPCLLEIWIALGTLTLHGEVVWTSAAPPDRQKLANPTFGVNFGKLRQDTADRLERILSLHGLPPPPWRARISFGMDAVSRMP